MKTKVDWFMPSMVVAVLLAWVFPEPGARGGFLHADLLNKAGVALIFFLHGVGLSPAALKAGVGRWPVHLLIQGCTFLLFPLIGLVVWFSSQSFATYEARLGFFYLCALPSTVSSSVALTAAAGGNVAVAVFNATLSSLLGVVVTPLWMSWIAATSGQSLELAPVILDLVLWLLLPFGLGQAARPLLASWAMRHKARIHVVDRLTILFLVYTSFCDSLLGGVWSSQGWASLLQVVVASLVLFLLVLGLLTVACRALRLPDEERIAALFCGSKKTLASGVPMARLIFGNDPALGVILLPIMIYHPLQLIVGGVLAGRWGKLGRNPA